MAIEDDAVNELLGGKSAVESQAVDELFGNRPNVARLRDLNIQNYDPLQKKKTSDYGYAPFKTMVGASSVDDPSTKLKIYAQSLFPNLPLEEAAKRVGVVEDAVVYRADDGKFYRADNPDFYARKASDVVGHAEPIVLGAALGTAAGGPMGTIAGAFYGAAGGEGFRKLRARAMYGEPQTWEGNIRAMGNEGTINALTTLPGLLLGKFSNLNVAHDIGNMDPNAAQLQQDAKRWGVQLTPPEITDVPSLRQKQKVVGKMPQTMDKVDAFMRRRGQKEVPEAVDRFLGTISPEDSAESAGRDLIDLSGQALENTRKEAMKPAAPYYARAYAEFKGLSPEMLAEAEALRQRPAIRMAEQQVMRNAKNKALDLGDPQKSLRFLHEMKEVMDQNLVAMQKDPSTSAKRSSIDAYKDARNALLSFIERASPQDEAGRSLYATGREIAGRNMAAAERTLSGALNVPLEMKESEAVNASRRLFDASRFGPRAVKTAMDALRKESPEQADAALRAFLQDQFDQASKTYVSQTGQATAGWRFFAKTAGDPRQMRVLESAMTPEQLSNFRSLMRVMEATNRAPMAGSDTAWNGEAIAAMKREGGSKLAALFQNWSPLDWGKNVAQWLDRRSYDEYANKVVDILTSPDGMRQMKELKALKPGSQAAMVKVSLLLGVPARVYARSQQDPQGPPPAVLAPRQ